MASSAPDVALYRASARGDAAEVARLLAAGADPHATHTEVSWSARQLRHDGAASWQAPWGQEKALPKQLPNSLFPQAMTALHTAAAEGHTRVVRTLLAAGALAAVPDALGYLPLHLAAEGGTWPSPGCCSRLHPTRQLLCTTRISRHATWQRSMATQPLCA